MMNRMEMTVNGDELENAEMRRTVESELDLVKIQDMTAVMDFFLRGVGSLDFHF